MKKLKVLIADDNDIITSAVTDELRKNPNLEEVFAIKRIEDLETAVTGYDVLVLDLEFRRDSIAGLQALENLMKKHQELKVIIFSNHPDKSNIRAAERCGAVGFIYKNEPTSMSFLSSVLDDICSDEKKAFINWSSDTVREKIISTDEQYHLDSYEKMVLHLKAEGYTIKEIANKMIPRSDFQGEVTDDTISNIFKSLSKKWGIINNQTTIIAFAIQHGIIETSKLNYLKPSNDPDSQSDKGNLQKFRRDY